MERLMKNVWHILEKILRFCVFKICHLTVAEESWKKFLQFVKFGMIGLSNTVISYAVYLVALLIFQKNGILPKTDYLVAQLIGFFLSVLWSFYWNRKYVFQADNGTIPWLQALLKTYLSYAFTGIFLNSVLSIVWVNYLGIPKIFAPVINLLISVPLNFILNKFWAFKEKKE